MSDELTRRFLPVIIGARVGDAMALVAGGGHAGADEWAAQWITHRDLMLFDQIARFQRRATPPRATKKADVPFRPPRRESPWPFKGLWG